VVTNSVLQHPPFTFARTASTLDHLTRGRFGWNIVTSFTESASRNVGLPAATDHDARYRWADEFCTVVYKLWEDSWEDGALVVDKEGGVYADAAKVREIDHEGERYSVPGPHLLPPSPQRTPMLFQAGTSTAGREFAARNAEGIFMISGSPDAAAPVVKDVTARAVAAGRRAEDLHFIQGLTFIIGSTEAEARRKEAELEEYIDGEAQVANFAGTLGLDLATIDPGEPLVQLLERVPGIRGAVQRMIDTAPAGTTPTMQDLARHTGKYWRVTGTPEQIADRLQQWVDAGITGINVMSMITPGTYVDFVDHAVPELQRRGLMQREYRLGTLREKLYPGRGPFLADGHPARAPRRPTSIGAQA
jgi:FMN-dependent oxidoreductase (nitrilotriacetate monooxygenase family)